MSQKRAVCLMSGGLDSAVVAAMGLDEGYEVYLLSAVYGQKASAKETDCVEKLARFYTIDHLTILDLTWLGRFGASGLTSSDVYLSPENARLEYVPFRNTVLLSAATAWAEAIGAEEILIGSTGGPWFTPDNSPEYFEAMQKVIEIGTMLKKDIRIRAPFCRSKKVEVVQKGLELQVPFELTWSCHNRLDQACGECSNCKDRRQAFIALGMVDPIPYVDDADRAH